LHPETAGFLKIVAYFGLMLGVLGTVAPVIPGPALVWASALLWAWADDFTHVGWPTLLVMGLLAVLASVSDLVVTTYGGRRGGLAWTSLLAAGLFAVLGFLVFSLPGAVVGSIGGALLVEWRRQSGDWSAAWSSSRGLVVGWVLSTVVEIVLVLLMLAVFTVQAFGPA